ncbi:hypothetical protein [Pseudogemmobacter sonorensis]|uniref:hypothetical protein n=1 Tax=Pseudogemmobacter sonorensis TaxID=2989681 RepID=UPI003673E2AD
MGVAPINWIQLAMLVALLAGSLAGVQAPVVLAVLLMLGATAWQFPRLLPMAQLFLVLALGAGALVWGLLPGGGGAGLWRAVEQGAGFAALMTVLGMLRHPVRRSATVRAAVRWLVARPPRRRFAAVGAGAQGLALLFNIGIIGMVGDLLRRPGEEALHDPGRRALVLGAMRGADLVTVWSPLGLGFAIVIAGIPALDPLAFLALAAGFAALATLLTTLWPMLPPEAALEEDAASAGAVALSARPLVLLLAVCALVLAAAIALHEVSGMSFTLSSATVLPVFALLWMAAERAPESEGFAADLRATLSGLTDMRSEAAIFLSANVIGTVIALLVDAAGLGLAGLGAGAMALPVLVALSLLIPLCAACFLPNSIVVVIAAQLFGAGTLGQAHPLALALVLAVGWASAIAVSPISAMSLMVARTCGTHPQRVAWRWNPPFAALLSGLGALVAALLVLL